MDPKPTPPQCQRTYIQAQTSRHKLVSDEVTLHLMPLSVHVHAASKRQELVFCLALPRSEGPQVGAGFGFLVDVGEGDVFKVELDSARELW